MRVGLRLVREGQAAGFVSAGNTGAAMVTAKMVLGVIPGVDRPALATIFPTAANTATIMLDVGANVNCKPQNLQQFAIMGEIYFRSIFSGRFRTASHPRVGLLSVGEEETKGNDLTREALALIKPLNLNFLGNVEGRDLYNGRVDVIVCDGFVGNVALKVSEGLVEAIRAILKESLQSTVTRQMGYLLTRNAYAEFKKRLDYSEYGGAPLLGVKGVAIVCHGSSNGVAIMNAIRVAAEFARSGLNQSIEEHIREAGERIAAAKAEG
jgi:glycerol-3-phosphate acyltransferase PlsX